MQAVNPHPTGTVFPVVKSPPARSARPVAGMPDSQTCDSAQERSRWLGRALARRGTEDRNHPLEWMLVEPIREDSRHDESLDMRCLGLIESLIRASDSYPESMDSSSLVAVLQWAWQHTENWDAMLREACLLKPFMPLYLCSALPDQERVGARRNAVAQSRGLALELIALIELSHSLGHREFVEWLDQRISASEDLGRSVQRFLNVDLSLISQALAEQRAAAGGESGPSRVDAIPISDSQHHDWWSLAWQWSCATHAFLVPVGVTDPADSWSELTSHWKTLYGLVCPNSTRSHRRCIGIRASSDKRMEDQLDRRLDDVRVEQGVMTLVNVRYVGDPASRTGERNPLSPWQTAWLECMDLAIEGAEPTGFLDQTGDLALVYQDLGRSELAQCVRDVMSQVQANLARDGLLPENEPVPLIVGIATVDGPAKSFRMKQLFDAATRCLENAASQGPGTIKSIEVF